MAINKSILACTLALALSGCFQTAPPENPFVTSLNATGRMAALPQADWLSSNQQHIAKAIEQAIRDKHPSGALAFPHLVVNDVLLFSQDPHGVQRSQTLSSAQTVLSSVSERLRPATASQSPAEPKAPTWSMELELEYFTKQNNTRRGGPRKALAHTGVAVYGVMCWQNTLAFCPLTRDLSVAEVRSTITTDTGDVITLTAHGGAQPARLSPTQAQTPLPPPREAQERMLVSALGDLSVKLAAQLQTR